MASEPHALGEHPHDLRIRAIPELVDDVALLFRDFDVELDSAKREFFNAELIAREVMDKGERAKEMLEGAQKGNPASRDGAAAFLSKPFEVPELLHVVRDLTNT